MSKQFYTWFTCCLFALLTALPLSVNATELTVCDGTTSNEYVPFQGYNADNDQHNQMIYPAADLGAMYGQIITQMVFYISTSSSNGSNTAANRMGTWTVSLGETKATTLSGLDNTTSVTQVYQGNFDCSTGTLTLVFSEGYQYNGGNLLVDINHSAASYNRWYFLGVSATGSSYTYGSQRNFLPKTTFTYEAPPSCAKPGTISLDTVTAHTAGFSWTASDDNETSWILRVKEGNNVLVDNETVSTPSYTVTGLSSSSVHTLSVEVIHACEDDSTSRATTLKFATLCEAIADLPWTEDFESMDKGSTTSEAPLCWSLLNANDGAYPYIFVNNSSSYVHGGTQSLYFQSSDSRAGYAILPSFADSALVDAEIIFYYKHENATSSGIPAVGYITNIADASTFVAIQELERNTSWTKAQVELGTIPSGARLAIRYAKQSSNYYMGIDDIEVRKLPNCRPPRRLWIDTITTNSAKLAWHPTAASGNYQVKVKNGEAVLADSRVDGDTTFVISGLEHSSMYRNLAVDIFSICSASDSSEVFSTTFSFNTACQTMEFTKDSLILGFNNYDSGELLADLPCWDTIRGAGVTADWKIYTPGYNNTAKSAYISGTGRGAGKYAVLISPAIEISAGYELQAYAKESSEYASDSLIFYVNDAPALEGATRIGDMKALSTSWQQFRQELGRSGELYILIQAYGAGTIYVDELLLKPAPVCPLTTGLVRDSLSYDYVRFSWNAAEGQNAWKVNISDTRGEIAVYDEVVNDPFYEIDYLEPLTTDTVTVKVIGMCEAGNSEEVLEETFIFTTLASCPIPDSLSVSDITGNSAKIAWKIGISDNYNVRYRLPASDTTLLSQDFENGMADWTIDGHSSSAISTSANHTGSKGFSFHYDYYNQYLISPELSGVDADGALEFYYKNSSTSFVETFKVGFSSTTTSAFTYGEEISASDEEWHKYTGTIPAGTKYICIQLTSYDKYNLYIDDIKVIGSAGNAGEWTTVENLAQKSAHLTGLTPVTKYEAQAQGICGDELSDWSSSVIFTTLPACILPANPTVRAIGVDSAVVAWSATHELYSVLIKQDTAILFQNAEYAGDSVILRDLTPATKYTINVSLIGLCSDELKSDTVVAPLSFITNCLPVTELPWSENFDAYAGSTSSSAPDGYPDDQLPLCWSFLNRSASSSSYPQLFISSSSGYPVAGKCLFFKSSKDEPLYAILPEFAFTLANKQIVFSYRNEGVSTSNGTLHLGYMTDVTDAESYVELQDFAQTTEITQHTIALATVPAGARVAFKYEGGTANNYYLAIDEIRVEKAPDCAKPTAFAVDSVSTHSISLSWASQSGISAWQVEYKKASAEVWTALEAPVNGTVVVLDSLDASTLYNVRLAAMCAPDTDPESLSAYVELSVATECETIASFPWSENFDAYTPSSSERVIPTCWNAINTTTHSSYQQYPTIVTDELAPTAPNSLAFVSYYSSYSNYDPQDQYAVLPEVEGISGLRMKLYAAAYKSYGTVYNATFTVGVMSNPSDVSTFEAIATNTATSEEFEPFTISFANYNGQGKYIAIKMAAASGSTYRSVFIDDIQIEEIPDCLEPAGLAVSNVTVEGATITWDAVEDGAWQYAIMSAAVAPADSDFVATTDTFVVISGKADNADFIFYLRTVCGEEVSPSVQIPFHTLQLPAEIGNAFSDNFEGENNWLFLNSAKHGWVLGAAAHNGEGTHAMYVSTDNGATHSYNNSGTNIVYAMKAFNLTAGNYIFGYDWLANGEGATYDWDYLRVALVPASVQLTAGQIPTGFTQSSLPAGWIALDGGSLLNLKQTWQSFESAEMAIAAGTYNVVFAWKNDGSGGSNPPAAIDNFRISKITCFKPTELAASEISSSKATISWSSAEDGAWQIALDTLSGFNPDSVPAYIAADTNLYHLVELAAGKSYYAYVRTNCGENGFSAWSSKLSFSTPAGNLAPTGLAVDASSLTDQAATVIWKGIATNDKHESFELYYSKLAALPETLNTDSLITAIADTMYSFSGLETETTYYVWVRDNCGSDGMSAWTAAVSFTTLNSCPVPANLSVANITAHTADIAWEIGNNESYNVRYRKPAGIDADLSEEFGTAKPTDWSMYTGLYNEAAGTATLTEASYGWSFGTGSNGVFDNHARVNIYGDYQRWLATPAITVNNAVLEFDLALTAYSGALAAPATTGTDDKFIVLVSEDNKASWQVLRKWDNAGSQYVYNNIPNTADGEHVSISLNAYNGKSIIIAFYGESTVTNADNNLHIDNVVVGSVIAEEEWAIANGTAAKQLQLTGLDPETTYEAQVQGICGTDATEWSEEIIRFKTIEACFAPSAPAVSEITAHGATLSWHSDADAWQICLNGDEDNLIAASDTLFVLTGLPADSAYTVKVRTNCGSEGFSKWSNSVSFTTLVACAVPTHVVANDVRAHSAEISWSSDATAWQICLDGNEDNLIDVTDTVYVVTGLAADTAHTVKVRANCGDEGFSKWSSVVRFTTLVSCPAPQGLHAELTPGDGSVARLVWESADANAWVVEYSLNANMSDSISVEVEAATLSLTGLTADTTYYARVKADCGDEDGVSLWSSVISFVPTDRYEMIINDGTATNTYIPFYLYYIEQPNSESQFIVPAEKLTSIAGDTITALTFYASQTVKFDSATFEVYMAEVNYTTVDTTEWSAMNKVMEEAHLSLVNNQMVVSLSTPYEYQGGNLMIGFKQPKKHTTYYNYVSWYGENAEGASYSIYGGSTRYAGQRNFLPKMKINFIPTDEETAVEEILNGAGSDDKAVKFIRDNRVYILRDGVVYDILGAVVR